MPSRLNKPGTFLRIPLADGSFAYGRVLQLPDFAFYDYRTTSPDLDLERIASKPVLFKLAVRQSWEVIGWRELEDHLTQPVVYYHQDVVEPQRCFIYDSAGNKRDATPEECVGIESDAVWEQHAIEERLLDAFMGRPNAGVEYLKARLR